MASKHVKWASVAAALMLLAAACGESSDPVEVTPAGAPAATLAQDATTAPTTTAVEPAATAPATTVPATVEFVSATPPEPGQQFKVRIGPADYPIIRAEGWTLSRDGKKLFTLAEVTRSAPPHYFPIVHSTEGSANSIALGAGTETLVWPEGLGPGTYKLCTRPVDHSQDLCVTITVDK